MKVAGAYLERSLLNQAGVVSGRSHNSVRQIGHDDFHRILALGLPDIEPADIEPDKGFAGFGFTEPQPSLDDEITVRGIRLTSRPLRDRAFRKLVLGIYNCRCALTGLRLSVLNDDGEKAYEAEAAHLRPVGQGGSDARSNGIALSRTIHWAFDAGLLSISEDHKILVSRRSNDPLHLRKMVNSDGRMLLPSRKQDWPHPSYLRWHRKNCFERH